MGSSSREDLPAQRSDGVMTLLRNSMTDLDDLRTLITCRVCIRPLYEPYTISCGHTFCYTCLRQWFDRDRTQKTCPDCRSKVVQQPAPAYLVRDITQIFISRAELLPAGETIEDHKKWQKEEADIVEKDKKNSSRGEGLFAGRFKRPRHHIASAIRDVEDGVDRCPMCAWELTDEGRCTSCAFEFDNGYPFSGSASLSVSDITDDDDDTFFMGDELELFDTIDGHNMSSLEESAHIQLGNLNHRQPPRTSAEVEVGASRVMNTNHYTTRRSRFHPDYTTRESRFHPDYTTRQSRFHPALERSYLRTATDDEFGDTDDDTSEEDDLGSLRDFIAEERETEDGSPMHRSPRSSHYDSDEASGIFEALGSYSVDEQFNEQGDNDTSQENTTYDSKPGSSANSSNIISIEDDDSDEGPVLRSRSRAYRRSIVSPESHGTAGDDISSITRRRRSTRESRRRASRASNRLLHQRNSQTSTVSESSSVASRAISIETESGSGSSPLARRPRATQGRSASSRITSDDEDDAATVSSGNTSAFSRPSSSGTMTIGRRSPARPDPSNEEDLATVGPTVILSSSPGRVDSLAYQSVYSNFSAENARGPHPSNPEPTPELVQRSVGSPVSRRTYRNSWTSRRHIQSSTHTRHASVLRSSASALHSRAIQRHQHVIHERTVRQAGRILKKERTQRRARERAPENFGQLLAGGEPGGVHLGSWFTSEPWPIIEEL